jgi:hypothetical protein
MMITSSVPPGMDILKDSYAQGGALLFLDVLCVFAVIAAFRWPVRILWNDNKDLREKLFSSYREICNSRCCTEGSQRDGRKSLDRPFQRGVDSEPESRGKRPYDRTPRAHHPEFGDARAKMKLTKVWREVMDLWHYLWSARYQMREDQIEQVKKAEVVYQGTITSAADLFVVAHQVRTNSEFIRGVMRQDERH